MKRLIAAFPALLHPPVEPGTTPIPMILFCPNCGVQHVDEPERCTLGVGCDETGICYASAHDVPEKCAAWKNPPHRSHLCVGCDHVWRPADVCTTGVAEIQTRGMIDDEPAIRVISGHCRDQCQEPGA